MVATVSVIFQRINLPNFVEFKENQGKSTRYFKGILFSFHYCEYSFNTVRYL